MNIKTKLKDGGAKALRTAMAGVVAFGLMPLPAFAADLQSADGSSLVAQVQARTQAVTAMNPSGYVIAAAYAAAEPAPEILGLNNPNFRSSGEATNIGAMFGNTKASDVGVTGDSSYVNEAPNPYVFNMQEGLTPGIAIGGRQGSPMSSLMPYDVNNDVAEQNSTWALAPHIILGTGSDTIPGNEAAFYDNDTYARVVETQLGLTANSYKPIGVTYNRVTLPTMVETMYRLAAAGDKVASEKNLKTRYGSALSIAKDYERYVIGAKGAVKKAIDSGKVNKKTVAVVSAYDANAKTYTITTDGVQEGTATTNRYLEAVQGVADNYYDKSSATADTTAKTKTASVEELKGVDLIIVNSNTNGSTVTPAQLNSDGLIGKAFYCTNWTNGSVFGVTVNSVENAQNIGRILPCLYPEVLDQSDMIAYYYDSFYHIKDSYIDDMIAAKMDGVRNWNLKSGSALADWNKSDVSDYNHDKVQAILVDGIGYLNSLKAAGEPLSSYLTPTDYLKDDVSKVDLKDAKVSVSNVVGSRNPASITVTYGSHVLVKDTDYTVAYAAKAGDAAKGVATITAKSGSNYTGSTTAEYSIFATENFSESTITVEGIGTAYAYTSEAITPKVTAKLTSGNTALAEGTDFMVAYSNNVNKGTATATITGIGTYAGTITKTFAINELKPTITEPKAINKKTVTNGAVELGYTSATIALGYSVDSAFTNDGGKLTYTSSDTNKVAVDGGGIITIKDLTTSGSPVTITVAGTVGTSGNCSAPEQKTLSVTVAAATKSDVSVSIGASSNGTITKTFGDPAFSLQASTTSNGALSYKFDAPEGSSVNPSAVLSYTQYGKVTIKGAGTLALKVTAAQTAQAASVDATANLVINKLTPKISLSSASIAKAATDPAFSLGATVDDAYLNDGGALKYASDKESVAKVDQRTGRVTIAGSGTAKITVSGAATDNCEAPASATATITVAAAKVAVPTGKTLAYTGAAQTGVTASGSLYTLTGNTGTNAGTYTAKAVLKDKTKYAWSDGTTADKSISWKISPASLASITPALSKASAAYTGKTQSGAVKSVKWNGKTLVKGTDYTVTAKSGKNAGSYAVTVTGKGNFTGTSKAATFKITQAANTVTAKSTKVSKSYTANKKTKKLAKAQTIALPKLTAKFGTAKWKVSTKDKKGVLSLSGSKVKVKAGAKKGTYTLKLTGSVAKAANYKAASSKAVTVTVKVK